jgi:hypothetical protein
MKVEVEKVANGIVNLIADFKPSKVFKDSDYDKTRSLSQWSSQTPVGHQTFFQLTLQPPKTSLKVGEEVLAEHEPGPWNMKYGHAIVRGKTPDGGYLVQYDREENVESITRDQIRKFSDADMDMSTSFEVGDLIFYEGDDGVFNNGVISQKEGDFKYSIYLLNTSGKKVHGVPRSSLINQFESADFVEKIPDLSIPKILGAFGYALKKEALEEGEEMSFMNSYPIGSGVVMTAFWKDGHAILKWDGLHHIDINLFTYEEDFDTRIAFQHSFCSQLDYIKPLARDEHPRGYGGVVNFASEIQSPPQWVTKTPSS